MFSICGVLVLSKCVCGVGWFLLAERSVDTGEPGGPIGLPVGPFEIPLVIQDKMFNWDGTLRYPLGEFGSIWAPEFFGDLATVNGKVWPNLNVDRGLYRFRILNGDYVFHCHILEHEDNEMMLPYRVVSSIATGPVLVLL
ncbi:MAG TPA: multicopper oxidase domain-containing protein [Pyrinomonadaceae bacterium]|jgi:FtsP/CotA-like multicopper oxidase with cupredoxin domain